MFTRPPSEAPPPPYFPGYIGFLPAAESAAASEEARLFNERIKLHREKLKTEREEIERAQAATQAAADAAWHEIEEERRQRRAKLKEESLKADMEWERLGGTGRYKGEEDAELRRKLDTNAGLTDEERTLKGAWEEYDQAWDRLTIAIRPVKTFTFRKLSFTFGELPWPVLRRSEGNTSSIQAIHPEDITGPAVAKFLLHPLRDPQKSKREKLREAILRYHPDKFEGRILPRVVAEDKPRVQEAVGIVMKCLNELMNVET